MYGFFGPQTIQRTSNIKLQIEQYMKKTMTTS